MRFDTFACSDDAGCVLNGLAGSCEASGYCSFPDPDCDAGSRYSQHASSALAGECVGSGGGGATGGSDDGTASGDTGGESSGTGEDTGGPQACVDGDGDGVGVGPGCAAEDCDDDNPATFDGCLYLGPGGDDANPGTRDAPWASFGRAIGQLNPGDSLVVLDGRYVQSVSGTVEVDCEEGNARSGTEALPIFVRAQNDLQAVIDREGRGYGILVEGCSQWRVRGLSIVSADNARDDTGAWTAVVAVYGSQDVVIRHVFGHHTNRYFNEHAFITSASRSVLFEDVEAHDFFRSGFSFYQSDEVTCRRCYAHSHEVPDLDACPDLVDCADPESSELRGNTDCPMCSAGSAERGDNSFYVEHSNDILLENCVSEGSARGYQLLGGIGQDDEPAGRGIRVVESLSLGDDRGFVVGINAEGIPTTGAMIEDVVVVGTASTGIEIRHPDDLLLRNVSVFGAGSTAVRVAEADASSCTDDHCSVTFERLLIEGGENTGFWLEAEPQSWTLSHSSITGSPDLDFPSLADDDPYDDAGNARDNLELSATGVGTGAGECLIYVPEDSNMADPFGDGSPVGANVTERFVDGEPTGEPLWSAEGGFPCIPDPAEPAQVAGEQCSDLAARVGFTQTCPPPAP